MNCRKQNYFARNCRMQKLSGVVINWLKGIQKPQDIEELKGIKGYVLKHFVFCYDNRCPVYKEVKYSASYWPQEPESEKLKDIEEVDRLWELDKDPIVIFNPESAKKLII